MSDKRLWDNLVNKQWPHSTMGRWIITQNDTFLPFSLVCFAHMLHLMASDWIPSFLKTRTVLELYNGKWEHTEHLRGHRGGPCGTSHMEKMEVVGKMRAQTVWGSASRQDLVFDLPPTCPTPLPTVPGSRMLPPRQDRGGCGCTVGQW